MAPPAKSLDSKGHLGRRRLDFLGVSRRGTGKRQVARVLRGTTWEHSCWRCCGATKAPLAAKVSPLERIASEKCLSS
jgi:hypothetical protein